VWRGHFAPVQGLPDKGGYMTTSLALEGYLVIKKKNIHSYFLLINEGTRSRKELELDLEDDRLK